MEVRQQPGGVFFSAHVEVKDRLAVGGIEEGNFVPPPFADRVRYAAGVSFGLFEHVFGAERNFFGFDDAEQLAVDEKGVVGGTGPGWVFFDGVTGERREVADFFVADDDPVEDGRSKPRIDAFFSCTSLGFSHCHTPFSVRAADALGRSSNGQATQRPHAAEIPRVLQKNRSSFYHSPSTSARLFQDYFRKERKISMRTTSTGGHSSFGENEQGGIWRQLESSPEGPVCSASSAVNIRRKRVMQEKKNSSKQIF